MTRDTLSDLLRTVRLHGAVFYYVKGYPPWVVENPHAREIIPANSITKAPSAELRPNQTDQDSLPPYDVLDAILEEYVVNLKTTRDIIAMGFDEAAVKRVVRLIDFSEYKRRQAAPGLKVTSKAFGVGRRIPIAQRYRDV